MLLGIKNFDWFSHHPYRYIMKFRLYMLWRQQQKKTKYVLHKSCCGISAYVYWLPKTKKHTRLMNYMRLKSSKSPKLKCYSLLKWWNHTHPFQNCLVFAHHHSYWSHILMCGRYKFHKHRITLKFSNWTSVIRWVWSCSVQMFVSLWFRTGDITNK